MTDLPESLAETWTTLGTRVGETSVLVVSITAETTLYEPVDPSPLADTVATEFPPRSLFAVDLEFSPSLSSVGISPESVRSKAASTARDQFVEMLADDGVVVEGVRDELEFDGPNGSAGTWSVLDVTYPVDADRTATDGDRVRAEAHVAVWPAETTFGVAGGTVPLEDLDDAGLIEDRADAELERDRERVSTLVKELDLEVDEDA
ncbi:hypothetical protein [Natrialba sp. INN-245]|uniref:hypothetical protein n=1 Tax=Natrialba sp. INN-245 TaxID=2690967 RepID=UPI0013134E13|nr:hypothetical protein [Natrialba sp. INN-245]MWV40786.1 hypothetical protein [Natrialba sp. INN-245]